jgi:metal-responsive CopG/Arc/MetJ family transcriptional regulator
VIRMSQKNEEEKWATIRIPQELLAAVDEFVKQTKDDFGLQKYGSKSEAIAEAVKEFLRKHSKKGA